VTAVATEFNLRSLIEACVEEGADNSPAAVSDRVMDALPEDELRAALRTALPRYVGSIFRLGGPGGMGINRHRGSTGRSKRWDDATMIYREIINGRVSPFGQSKSLGECQVADLVGLARDRKRQADDLLQRGRDFLRLADELKKAKVQTVAQLPAKTVLEILD